MRLRAACYVGNRTLEVVDETRRSPGRDEVQIDVAYTGICGTDLHILHGAMDARVTMPAILGHEMSGTVGAIGEAVQEWRVGDRVTVMPLAWDGTCPACAAGNQHVCQNLKFLGIDTPGSMQSAWTVPQQVLVPLPPELSLRDGALAEPTAVAVHDVRRAGLREGERALIVGGGPIGLLIALVARAAGVDVIVAELNPERRRFASELDLRALDPREEDLPAVLAEWTGDAGADVCFEVSGAVAGIETAVKSLAVRGRMVLVAIHSTPPPVDLFRFFWRELSLIGARVYQRADFEEALRLLASGAVPAEQMITRVEPITRVAAAFEDLESGRGMKTLIDCEDAS